MFGRTKSQQPAASTESSVVKVGGKGRPTPTRKQSQARIRHPLISSPAVRPGASKEEVKAARAARREAMAAERARERQAMLTGDERYLPARDKGPARRFARDYVDARRSLGEYLLPFTFVLLVATSIRVAQVQLIMLILLYVGFFAVVIDSFLLRRKIIRLTKEKFGDKADAVGGYAMMRALLLPRTRMPRPQVKRGEFPS